MGLQRECAIALDVLDTFIQRGQDGQGGVIRQTPLPDLLHRLRPDHWIRHGGLTGQALHDFLTTYLASATNLHHPAYMAHQVAVPAPLGTVAALVDGATNNAMAIYEMGPSAATVEFAVINWMLELAGWRPAPLPGHDRTDSGQDTPVHGGGVLTHGGSLANLTALAAARRRAAPHSWRNGTPGDLAIIAPANCHYSITRAAALLGLGAKAVHAAPTDDNGIIQPDRLEKHIRNLTAQGKTIMAVVANAASTAAGLYDPIRPIAHLCRSHGIWLHVDGAHGAAALVSDQYRSLLDGLELADSLVWDAHKMLRSPTLCAAILVRDHRDLDTAFQEDASYLFHDKEQPGFDFIHRTVECTKAALGLKMLFALAAEGQTAMAAFVERQFALARAAAEYLSSRPEFQVAVTPQANIVCFRVDAPDSVQLDLRKALTAEGDYYISTTEFRNKRWLRLALMNPQTAMPQIVGLANRIVRLLAAGAYPLSASGDAATATVPAARVPSPRSGH